MIILTSFNDHDIDLHPEYKIYSISDKQPSDLDLSNIKYGKIEVFVPNSVLFSKLTEQVFSEMYLEELENRLEEIKKVMRDLFFSSDNSSILLCCWCNENFKKEKTLFCHRVIIKKFMDKHFPYIQVDLRGFKE